MKKAREGLKTLTDTWTKVPSHCATTKLGKFMLYVSLTALSIYRVKSTLVILLCSDWCEVTKCLVPGYVCFPGYMLWCFHRHSHLFSVCENWRKHRRSQSNCRWIQTQDTYKVKELCYTVLFICRERRLCKQSDRSKTGATFLLLSLLLCSHSSPITKGKRKRITHCICTWC